MPDQVAAEWVSHRGEVVEVGLWNGPGSIGGRRSALIWPTDRLVVTEPTLQLPVSGVRATLYEPDGAVIRAGGVGQLGRALGASLLDPQIAYLSADDLVETPYATAFRVVEVLPYTLKGLRRWMRTHQIGSLEIKKRGLDLDPAALRPRLGLTGPGRATLIISRTPRGAVAIIAERLRPSDQD